MAQDPGPSNIGWAYVLGSATLLVFLPSRHRHRAGGGVRSVTVGRTCRASRGLTPDELDALIAFLRSLKSTSPAASIGGLTLLRALSQ